jgi:telomere length regulation protein
VVDIEHERDIMDDLLTPLSTVKRHPQETKPVIEEVRKEAAQRPRITSPEEVLKVLKHWPDLDTVGEILRYLASESQKKHGFNLVTPEPLSASIAFTLATVTVPDYWRTLKEKGQDRKNLVRLLSNPNGVGAILSRLRPLIADCRQKKPAGNTRDSSEHIEDLLDILDQALVDDGSSSRIWNDIQDHATNPIQLKLMWKEYVAQTASGRILSIAAEAEDVLKEKGSSRAASWVANGNDYAAWLGRNVAILMKDNIGVEDSVPAVTEICGKALLLGYTGMYLIIVGIYLLIR